MIKTFQQTARTWYLFAFTLKILLEKRSEIQVSNSKDYELAAINSSILLHTATIVEGAVRALLTSKIERNDAYINAKQEDQHEIIRAFDSILNSLQDATWEKLSENLSGIVLGFKLKEVYDKDWQSIKYLFAFRNVLAHGGLIIYKRDKISNAKLVQEIKIEETRENLTKKDLFHFLSEKGLIPIMGDVSLLRWKFINAPVSDYFLDHSKNFLKALYKKYEEQHELDIFYKEDLSVINKL